MTWRSIEFLLALEGGTFRWNNILSGAQIEKIASGRQDHSTAVINVCPYIPLTGKTFQSYLAELGSEHRYNFHRRLRQMNRDFTVTFEAAAPSAIDTLIELHNLRRESLGGSDAFHTPELVAFHREFAALAFHQRWLRLYELRLNGKAAACLYGFLYQRKFYYYQSGLDPAFEKYSPGMIALGLVDSEGHRGRRNGV